MRRDRRAAARRDHRLLEAEPPAVHLDLVRADEARALGTSAPAATVAVCASAGAIFARSARIRAITFGKSTGRGRRRACRRRRRTRGRAAPRAPPSRSAAAPSTARSRRSGSRRPPGARSRAPSARRAAPTASAHEAARARADRDEIVHFGWLRVLPVLWVHVVEQLAVGAVQRRYAERRRRPRRRRSMAST